jgi:hypothetical protein
MSMETHVFFRGKLPSKAALTRAMKELGLQFSITPATGSLEAQSGYMPMRLRGEETGVEFDVYGDHVAVEEFGDVGVDAGFERRASLRWGGDFQEAVAGMSVAAALARNGVVFDEAEGRLLSADEAIALVRQNLQVLIKPEERKRPGTRPADLKRYLKPLLKLRPDLMLIGRLLIIRPVRHLLRGAFSIAPATSMNSGSIATSRRSSPSKETWAWDFSPTFILSGGRYGNHISRRCFSTRSPRTYSTGSGR